MNKEKEQIDALENLINDARQKLKVAMDELGEKEKLEKKRDAYKRRLADNEAIRLSSESSKGGIKNLKKRYVIEIISLNLLMMMGFACVNAISLRVIIALTAIIPSSILLIEKGKLDEKEKQFDKNIANVHNQDIEFEDAIDDINNKLCNNMDEYNELEEYISSLNSWLEQANELLNDLKIDNTFDLNYDIDIEDVPKRKRKEGNNG